MPEIIVKLGDRIVQKYLLYKDQRLMVGRAPDNDIAIENPAVSRRHASIQQVDGRYIIEDNNSANGTYVNGVRVTKTEILDKDVITIGKHKLHFYNQEAPAPAVQVAPVMEEKTMMTGQAAAPAATLRVTMGKQKDQSFTLNKVETHVGRAPDNDIRLQQDWFVSKHHAVIGRKGSAYVIKDLESWRHTMVNGEIVTETTLKDGDEIQFGPKVAMRFEVSEAVAAPVEGSARRPVELGEPPKEPPPQEEGVEILPVETEGVIEKAEERSPEVAATSGMTEAVSIPVEAAPEELEPEAEEEAEEVGVAAEESGEEHDQGGSPEHGSRRKRRRKRRRDRHGSEMPGSPAEAAPQQQAVPVAPPPAEPVAVEAPSESVAPAPPPAPPSGEFTDAQRQEIAMWEKALANPSQVIRKQALRKLKQLTGRDYDAQ